MVTKKPYNYSSHHSPQLQSSCPRIGAVQNVVTGASAQRTEASTACGAQQAMCPTSTVAAIFPSAASTQPFDEPLHQQVTLLATKCDSMPFAPPTSSTALFFKPLAIAATVTWVLSRWCYMKKQSNTVSQAVWKQPKEEKGTPIINVRILGRDRYRRPLCNAFRKRWRSWCTKTQAAPPASLCPTGLCK